MTILDVTPMLTVVSINDSVRFYSEVLGFSCIARVDGWATVAFHGVEVMFSLANEHLPFIKPEMTGSLYFKTDDADALWERLRDRCEIVYPIENFDYGMREFAVRDNSGYLLQFGQRLG
jgi:uncharacterized glyoxalase superfamily protein PhnB